VEPRHASRRSFLIGLAAAAGTLRSARPGAADTPQPAAGRQPLRVRTLTAGVPLETFADLRPVEAAIDALLRSKRRVEEAGYEVQTLRVATPSILGTASAAERRAALAAVQRLDDLVARRDVILSIGSILSDDRPDPGLAAFVVDLVQATRATSFSVTIASDRGGAHRQVTTSAAEAMLALSRSTPGGIGNFSFAAAANVPAGTPFFPVAHHDGPAALAVGLESPRLLRDAIARGGMDGAERRMRASLDTALAPIATVAEACARDEGRSYLGIDPSPAPGLDSSIGEAIEALTGRPFGGPSTLDACALVTGALKQLRVKTCGYAGLMLPVLEDPVLARRAAEGRYGLGDLLLFSSVCGTGLDVVPVPGDTTPGALARVVADVAALSVRLRKPLSARLFPAPGRGAGDAVTFDDPMLTGSVVFRVE
jgi:uncharacterized protein (UPF0210 family)